MKNQPYWKDLSLNDLEGELWSSVLGYEGLYEVSNLARIKSLGRWSFGRNQTKRFIKPRIFKQQLTNGYLRVCLTDSDGNEKSKLVHILVSDAFIEKNGKPIINHLKGVKTNNLVNELERATHKENCQHALKTGLSPEIGGTHHNAKLDEEKVIEIIKSTLSAKELSEKYNVTIENIYSVRTGNTWSHVTGIVYSKKKFLDKDIVLSIFNSKSTPEYLAIQYNVKISQVWDIRSGRRHSKITRKVQDAMAGT